MQCMPCVSNVTIVLLNVRSVVAKLLDIQSDQELCSANVLCFCETWLSPAQTTPVVKGARTYCIINEVASGGCQRM